MDFDERMLNGVSVLSAVVRNGSFANAGSDERFPLYALYPSRNYLPAKTRIFLDFIAALG